jgi:hypothetical protein
MTLKVLILSLALPLSSFCQLQIFQFDGTNETPIGASLDLGQVAIGDSLQSRFRVRNEGSAAVTIQNISLAGTGFQLSSVPSLPYILAPGAPVDLKTQFTPTIVGSYSAALGVNSVSVLLRATSVISASLYLENSTTPLVSGATIDFGSQVRGTSTLHNLRLSNPGSASMTVNTVSVTGTGFRGPIGITAPVQLPAGQSVTFQVAFEPQSGQSSQGTLTLDQRSFVLTGQGLDPPLPSATIQFNAAVAYSAEQMNVSIPLAAASQVSGTGTLKLEFQPFNPGLPDDPAIRFASGPARLATVSISPGDTAAKFGTNTQLGFQTGTIAGTLVFTLTLPNGTTQMRLPVAPVPVSLQMATGVRESGALDISLVGFDNTLTLSQLSFTFYDSTNKVMQPGAVPVDVSSAFQNYFAGGQYGGTFALLAKFPVTGDTTQIGSVVVAITSSAGVTTTQQLAFTGP